MTAWDAIARLWRVPSTWLTLRKPRSEQDAVAALAREQDPAKFVRRALVPAAGPLALALAWLPDAARREAEVVLLAGLALREIDRRAAVESAALARLGTPSDAAAGRDRIRTAVGFLTGRAPGQTSREPRVERKAEAVRHDSVRGVLAGRLSTLRQAIEALPGDAVRRCRTMIEQLGDSVIHDRLAAESGTAGADTFGEAVMYAMRLAAPAVRPPDATCRAVGRALELVAALDADRAFDGAGDDRARRERLRARAVAELAHMPRLARWLPGRVNGGMRAALALWVTSECDRLLRALAPSAAAPLSAMRAALAAARSRKAFVAAVDRAVEAAIAAVPALAEGTLDTRRDRAVDATAPAEPAAPADDVGLHTLGGTVVSPVRITINTPARGTRASSPSSPDRR